MLFFSEFKQCVHALNPRQRHIILCNIVLLNIILILIVCAFALRIQKSKLQQAQFIQSKTVQQHIPIQDLAKINDLAVVEAKVYIVGIKDINLKDSVIPVNFILSTTYKKKDFPQDSPQIELANGTIISKYLYYKSVDEGIVHEVVSYEANIEPIYQLQLYPLDKQVISIRPMAKNWLNEKFNIKISDMYLDSGSLIPNSDYVLEKSGFANSIDTFSIMIGHKNKEVSSVGNTIYTVFNHKNVYTYIKHIQYIVLAILIALFSLLINAKTASPKNGRVAVIGSSVFSLAANVFQINSTIRATNVFTLVDFITIFAGLIILMSYVTTVKTLKLIDTESYETSKAFDLSVFYCLLAYIIIFFTSIYIYA